jgi:glucose/arabinose dehydrogenase
MNHSRGLKGLILVLGIFTFSGSGECYDIAAWLKARILPSEVKDLSRESHEFKVETAVEDLVSPWAIVFTPDGRTLVTERPGRLRVIKDGKLDPNPVRGVPRVSFNGQGGLLDITLHPNYQENRYIYLAFTVSTDPQDSGFLRKGGEMTRVARFKDAPDGLRDMKVIFSGALGSEKPKHFGCRVRFGADMKLYITLGERGEGKRAQDLMDLNGKTLRLNEDGSIPDDNPFARRKDARPEIFSYGNRNSQGMAIQPGTGIIFQTEHGPSWNDAPGGGDEVNILTAGGNYGWPLVHHREKMEGTIPPLLEYTPAIAPSGATFYTGSSFPKWKGDLFFVTLVGRKLIRVKLDGLNVIGQEFLLEDRYGRLRDVAQGPDGLLYVLTSETDAYGPGRERGDRLLRLVPKP